jgi:hypothetical protein
LNDDGLLAVTLEAVRELAKSPTNLHQKLMNQQHAAHALNVAHVRTLRALRRKSEDYKRAMAFIESLLAAGFPVSRVPLDHSIVIEARQWAAEFEERKRLRAAKKQVAQ